MAELILFNFVDKILSKLASYSAQQVGIAWGVQKELRKLENTMFTIKNILLDAQEQRVSNLAENEWLQRLKLVVYDADDLLDEFITGALERQVKSQWSMTSKVRYSLTQSNPIQSHALGHKIKDIWERLDEITSDMRKFEFAVRVADSRVQVREREESYSFVSSSDVIGRGGDKKAIVQLLISSIGEENVSIIPIVGMGGLGKTTLAQLVYNDDLVSSFFGRRLWVCISDDFDVKGIIVKILQVATNANYNELGIEVLQNRLREILSDGHFLLVLDDVWNEDPVEWKKLQDLLTSGVRGSKIIVTTRSKRVASITGTVEPYELKGLSDNECLSILLKWAFLEGKESQHKELVSIGREIVKKCGGVPLAARTLGGILFSRNNERDWLSVRDDEMWALVQKENDILPVLRLSYDQMPSYLKQCFAYCSLYEKDQVIHREQLIYRWMAQGFIHNQNEELEETGEHYFDELVRRSFLETAEFGRGYKMHDLVHDLAQFVAGNECFTVTPDFKLVPQRVFHLSFNSSLYGKLPRPLLEVKKLRTIVFPRQRKCSFSSSVETLFSKFRYLRVLDFNNDSSLINNVLDGGIINILPTSIKNLKHLRFLSLKHSYGMKKLPKSFGSSLLNLQYLDLYGSELCELPEDFGKLINLRFLCLSSELTCLPEKAIGGLTSLQKLVLHDNPQLTSLGEGIRRLTCLRQLVLWDCPQLTSLPSGMRHLTALEHLETVYCAAFNFSKGDLRGLVRLRSLSLIGLPRMVSLPKGLEDAAATLNHVVIHNCRNLKNMSRSLPNLTSLRRLELWNCPSLLSLPEGMQHLTSLRYLKISLCPSLSRRCKRETGKDWNKIAHVPEIEVD